MRTIAVLFAALVLALAGCGGDDENGGGSAATSTPTEESTPEATPEEDTGGGGGGGGETIQLASPADGSLVFEPDTLTAAAGEVTIEYDNPAGVPHAVSVEGNGVEEESDEITDSSTSLTVELEAGEYTFYCPVPGHREGGMEGTLTVE
jgi:plastocyanin